MVDTCVVCGDIVPEGVQVCPQCYQKKENVRTNLDDIRTMIVDELVDFIINMPVCCMCPYHISVCGTEKCRQYLKDWLLKGVKKND